MIWILLVLGASASLPGQTFEINNNQNSNSNNPPKKGKKSKSSSADQGQNASPSSQQGQAPSNGIGWGSGIEVAREARTAQQALNKGDYKSAATSALRAARSAPKDAYLWFLYGYSSRLAGNYNDSVDGYKRGLALQPSSIQGLSGLAQTYAKMGRGSEAQDLLKQVLAANPRSVTDLQLAGELALTSDPTAALELLKKAEALQSSARNDLLIARAYQRLNQPEQSRQYLERAQRRAPDEPDVLRAVAAFYRDTGKYDAAISNLQRVVAKAPEALGELAYTYQLAGKKKEAAETYSKAASRSPRDAGLQLSAAQAAVNIGEFDPAANFLKRAEAVDPNSYRLHAIRGQIASLEDRNDEAVREYQFALSHLPEVAPEGPLYPVSLHLSLYELYQRTEQPDAAQAQLNAAKAALAKISGVEEASKTEFLRLRALIEADSGDTVSAEKDLKAALALDPNNVNIILNYANLLWRTDRKQDAYQMYTKALNLDPNGHSALTALGYLSREIADAATAEKYFLKLETLYPKDYVPYLALGDLYTSQREFDKAQNSYEKAHELAPNNPLVVAGAINSSLEGHRLPVAQQWIDRAAANQAINQNPQVMREHERYLTMTGKYEESAQLGYKVLEKLPHDPEAPVYLAYDLLYLNRFDEAFAMAQKYEPVLPKDKDLPMIAGYVEAHRGNKREAEADFTRSLALNENATVYMNRGYVRNDLREASKGAEDFEAAIKLRPDYGEAHLGLAFADLQLHRAKPALKEADIAMKLMGESGINHLAKAEAYRQQIMFRQAEEEYRAALKFSPNDIVIRLALAEALYRLRRYNDAIEALKAGIGLTPDDSLLYAEMSRNYAQLRDRQDTFTAVTKAEQHGDDSKILMATGEAMLVLGEHKAAMDRYARALNAPNSDRVEVRLALARLFVDSGRQSEAQDQVSFALAEARVSESGAVTPENLIEAGDVLRSIQQFELAKKYYERAQSEGADEEAVAFGLANAYLGMGQTQSAAQILKSMNKNGENDQNYDYLLAMGNVYRQEQKTDEALTMFARATQASDGNDYLQQMELDLAGDEGRQLTPNVNVRPDFLIHAVFEDINIYQLDARIKGLQNLPALLPPPRSSVETIGGARYKLHFKSWPVISGVVEERNARGTFLFPSELLIQNRNTYDTIFNGGVNPVLHFGNNTITFNPGLQFTIRRDTDAPVDLNQNLFRQYVYIYTSPFFNWITVSASGIREAGPFTEQNLHSRDAAGTIDFIVGRPWSRTSLLTGYSVRDLLYRPLIREYYTTSTYVGVQHRFGNSWKAAVFAEYMRSWRVQDSLYAIAQAMRPAFQLDYQPLASHWAVHAAGVWSRGEGFHAYDNISNEVTVSYMRSTQHAVTDGLGTVPVTYPMRFSFGIQQQSFYDFQGNNRNTVLPVIHLNFF
ncbi:MAG TPA: tetratricopeptide repeat protein [Terriglobales bacterium]|nr:tetratricopeptide repeat protein [Terriglobales bacterium]